MISSIVAITLPAFILGVIVGVIIEHRSQLRFNAQKDKKSDG